MRSAPLRAPLLASAALLLAALTAMPALAAITIGPGPARGTDRAGVTWYEDFQDWTHGDLKALDRAGLDDSIYRFSDGFDDSRDIVAFYERVENDNVYFRVDLYDLALGAENGNLDVYVAVDCAAGGQPWFPDFTNCQTDRPWDVCVCVYNSGTVAGTNFRLYDQNFNQPWNGSYLGSYFNSQLDAVEFGIRRQVLIDAGWNGTSPLACQVFTTKDGAGTSCGASGSKLTDAIQDSDRGCADGVLNGAAIGTDSPGVVYYASVAHGNQSVNQADDIGAHIYDPQANTGISGGCGFARTLDTHEIFRVPLNIHPSGTLTTAALWAKRPGGAADPQDGPSFLARVRQFVNDPVKGSLIGGVFAEHILPYYEGPVNARSIAVTDSLNQVVYGVSAAAAKVMHVPERVIRSQSTNLSPLDGHTFEDIAASPYQATYLDEVTHLHWWFYSGESCTPDQGYRHKVHKINGVYCFAINDREDQGKFGNHDGGAVMDTRYSLLQKALFGGSSEIVLVFDDWEALAGKSFDATSGNSLPNNNPNQYHNTIRWLANHPWIQVSNLRDLLTLAVNNPAAFVIDHGYRYDLGVQTYEWLKHASEDSYNYWYYNNNAGFGGNEQNFYDLVPVISGPQGDYHARGATPASDGPPLPSGRKHGDLNSPGTLMYDTWALLQAAPRNRLRELGEWSYLAMIYETAWHEEDALDYSDSNCYGAWYHPDASWDGVNTWALRLQNHVRNAGVYAYAAQWADSVRRGLWPAGLAVTRAADLDQDGEAEYVIATTKAYAVFEKWGGRGVLACVWNPARQDADVVIGAPIVNPSAPGEEEYTGQPANRCSAFKDMNGGTYADAAYVATAWVNPVSSSTGRGWTFTSPDGKVSKSVEMALDGSDLFASYTETVSGPLFLRIGLSPNPLDLIHSGQAHLASALLGDRYRLRNTLGGGAQIEWPGGVAFNAAPSWSGADRRNLAQTEEVELSGDGAFTVTVKLRPDTAFTTTVVGAPPATPRSLALRLGPSPVRAGHAATLAFALPAAADVRVDVLDASGRRVRGESLGVRAAGEHAWTLAATDGDGRALAPGLYFVRLAAGRDRHEARWVVLE